MQQQCRSTFSYQVQNTMRKALDELELRIHCEIFTYQESIQRMPFNLI